MNRPFFDRRSHARSAHPESDVFEIRRPAAPVGDRGGVIHFPEARVPAMPYAGSPIACEVLATMALDHALAGEHLLARRAAEDALLVIESLTSVPEQGATAACAALTTGEAFLLLDDAHRSKGCFEIAARSFDGRGDLARAAQARVGLAKALLTLRDPTARAVLEDAGEIFEDLGDQESVLAIDFALRQAHADFEESPRSFHARASTTLAG